MSVRLLPDTEALCVAYLIAHPDVSALCDDRVYTEVPENPTYPFVTLFRVGGRALYPRWVDQAHLQIDAWGNDDGFSREDTRDLCETVIAALHEAENEVTDFGVVTAVEDVLGPRPLPDPETSFPRFEAEVFVTAHPGTEAS